MTEDELKQQYTRAYRILHRERTMRDKVLRGKPDHAARVAEMEEVIAILTQWKDELKQHIQPVQPELLHVPTKRYY